MAEDWPLVTALLGGTRTMRAAGKSYLPQWPNEEDTSYQTRLKVATLFPAFARTVEVLAGKPFSKPVTIDDDVPPRIKEWCEDIDLTGRNLHNFCAAITASALAYGLAGILVDHPATGGLRTKADEDAAGVRPYFVEIRAENILGWKSKRINGKETLLQLRLLESAVEDDGEFGEKMVEQVRVIEPTRWRVYREQRNAETGKMEWVLHEEGVSTLGKIAFAPVYAARTGFLTARPPLLELAHLNAEHWQSKSDQQTILHVARVPILFGKMMGETTITVGASSAVLSSDPAAELKFVEHTGKAIESGRMDLLDLEDRMRQIGAELLVIKPGDTTVAQTIADNEPGMCALQKITEGVEDAIDQALDFMAEWAHLPDGGHIQLFKDFGVSSLSEASMDLLREMNVDGTLSDESLYREAQRRGLISPDMNWEDEKSRIAQNKPKPGKVQLEG